MTASIISLREIRLARRQGGHLADPRLAAGAAARVAGLNDNETAPLFAPGDYILARPLPANL